MDKKIMKFGYEDTDKKIEIELYGLVFEIKDLNKSKVEELEGLEKRNNKEEVEKQIDAILGEGSVDKINEKRIQDGYDKIDIKIGLAIFGCILQTYSNSILSGLTEGINKSINGIENNISDMKNLANKNQNRNYNNNRRYNRNYNNRNYRRY